MMMRAFNAVCPVEIGDEIVIIGEKAFYIAPGVKAKARFWYALYEQGKTHVIKDIASIMYCKSGKIEFRYRLDEESEYRALEIIQVSEIK